MKKLVLASNNAGKLRELAALLDPLGLALQTQAALGVADAEEPYHTFVENALAKARHASQLTGLPALADDSGLCVPALNGAPGVHSARFAGPQKSDADNNQHLIAALDQLTDRRAFYYCVLVLVTHADDPCPLIADGSWWGEIIAVPRGNAGFGYDPHFYIPALTCTAAELTAEHKNQLSHRGQALQHLHSKLQQRLPDRSHSA